MHYPALMDDSTTVLAAAIGDRVRRERQARRWTLDQLAEVSGVSRRMLVNVEHGVANPSVGTLLRLSRALEVGLPALVEPPQRKPVKVTRRGEGLALWTGGSGGRGVLVASTGPPHVVELWEWTLLPGDQRVSEPHAAGTKELLHVHQGTLALVVADQEHTLSAGDAVSFPGDVGHSYSNPGKRRAAFSLTVFEPGVGSVSRVESADA